MKRYLYILIAILILVIGLILYFGNRQTISNLNASNNTSTPTLTTTPNQTNTNTLALPIAQFKERVTKKPFGIYITPETSPIQPEKFSGFHTAVDVEYQDVTQDVPVYAINDGTIELARTASGYGGVILMKTQINGVSHSIVYGHVRPSSLAKVKTEVKKGEQIGLLGTGYSTETDGERRHLHFAVLSNNRIDIKGYVQNQSELSGWIDPLTFYR